MNTPVGRQKHTLEYRQFVRTASRASHRLSIIDNIHLRIYMTLFQREHKSCPRWMQPTAGGKEVSRPIDALWIDETMVDGSWSTVALRGADQQRRSSEGYRSQVRTF